MSSITPPAPISRLDRILLRASIDPQAYRALIRSYLLMDFRNQQFGKSTATGPKALISPLFWVLGQNLIMGLCASVVMFARVDIYFFTLIGLGLSMITVAASVIVEFNEIVLDPEDLAIIGHRPIPSRTYAAARVTNLLGYVLVTSCSLWLFPAIVGAGMRDALSWHVPAYIAAALIGDIALAGLIILVYLAIAGGRPAPGAQEILAWLQVGMILILFYGGQIVLRDSAHLIQWVAYDLPAWTIYLPPAWLALGVTESGLTRGAAWILPAGALVAVAIWIVVLQTLSVAYARLQPGRPAWAPISSPPLQQPGELAPKWMRALTRAGEERAAFWLTWTMLRRDPNLRMRCWPAFGTILALLIVGAFTGQLADPLRVKAAECVMTLGSVYLLGAALPSLFHNLRFSSQFECAWVLSTSPVINRKRFASGQVRAILVYFLLPVSLLMISLFLAIWRDPLHAAVHVLLALSVTWGMAWACAAMQLRRDPFSAPLARGSSFGPIAPLAAATAGIGMGLATVHAYVCQQPTAFAAFAAAVVAAAAATIFLSQRSLSASGSAVREAGR